MLDLLGSWVRELGWRRISCCLAARGGKSPGMGGEGEERGCERGREGVSWNGKDKSACMCSVV